MPLSITTVNHDHSLHKATQPTDLEQYVVKYTTSWDPIHPVYTISHIVYANIAIFHAMITTLLSTTLPGCPAIGFDLEWKQCYGSNQSTWPATVQLTFDHVTLVLIIKKMGDIPDILRFILSTPNILKVGVGIVNDALKMAKEFGVHGRGYVELSMMAWIVAWDRMPVHRAFSDLVSLKDLARAFAHMELTKYKSIPDWDMPDLTPDLVSYAACDSYASLSIFRHLEYDFEWAYDGNTAEVENLEFYWTFDMTPKGQALDGEGKKWKRKPPFERKELLHALPSESPSDIIARLTEENFKLKMENEKLKTQLAHH